MVRDTPALAEPRAATAGLPDWPASPASSSRTSWPSDKAAQWILWALIVPVAAVLRFHDIAAKSFWLDEGMSAEIARLPWLQFFRVLWNREINMALYYLLLRFYMHIGSSETFVRGLSVLFSVATVPLIYALGARLFGRAAGLTAAWLLAIGAYQVRYAQEARAYALAAFLATLATWLLVRNLQRPAFARWGAYSAVCALLVYAQLFGALLVLAHGVSLLWLPRDSHGKNHLRNVWKDFGRAVRWFVWLILPVVAVAVHIGSTPAAWIRLPTAGDLSGFFQAAAGNAGIGPVWLDALLLLAAALALRSAWRDKAGSASPNLGNWPTVLVFAWLFVPLMVILSASIVRPLFLGRYLMFCLPALALGLAAGLARLRPAIAYWALLAVISVLSVQGTVRYYRQDFDINREDWRSATSYLLDHAQPGDAIFFSTFSRIPYEYYKSQRPPALSATTGPMILNWPGGAQLDSRDFIARPVAEMLTDARPAPDRVWLVLFLDHAPSGQVNPTSIMLRAVYEKGRRLIEEREFPQITIFLFARDQPPGGASSAPRH